MLVDPKKKSLMEDSNVQIANKIHVHLRIQLNFALNLLDKQTNVKESCFRVENLVVDFLKPVGQLKTRALMSFNGINFNYNASAFQQQKRTIMSIFSNLGKSSQAP